MCCGVRRREICQLPLRRQNNKPNLLTRLRSFHEHGYCFRLDTMRALAQKSARDRVMKIIVARR